VRHGLAGRSAGMVPRVNSNVPKPRGGRNTPARLPAVFARVVDARPSPSPFTDQAGGQARFFRPRLACVDWPRLRPTGRNAGKVSQFPGCERLHVCRTDGDGTGAGDMMGVRVFFPICSWCRAFRDGGRCGSTPGRADSFGR
jgi:hypothetical protein